MSYLLKDDYFVALQKNLISINPWCDMLWVTVKEPIIFLDNILSKLDSDNSELYIYDRQSASYSINKSENKEFIFCDINISIDNISYKIAQYAIQKSKEKQKLFHMYGKVLIYSTLFRILELQESPFHNLDGFLQDFFNEEYDKFIKQPINRYDYKLDFIYDTDTEIPEKNTIIDDKYRRKSDIFYRVFNKWERSTWWVIWNNTNKSYKLRLYDKKIDTMVKNKWHLYSEYLWYKWVLRLEWEFRTKFMKDISWNSFSIRDLENLEHKARVFFLLEQDSNITKFLQQYRRKYKDINNILKDVPYIKNTMSRLLTIAKSWVNPFTLFINTTDISSIKDLLWQRSQELDLLLLYKKLKKHEE